MTASVANLIGRGVVQYRPMTPDATLVLPDCLVGIEMELEGDTDNEVMGHSDHYMHRVEAKHDGSLRNGGVELVFNAPLMGDAVVEALKWMFKLKDEYDLEGSTRTSTHMHINYSGPDDTGEVLVNTIVLWLLLEKAMCQTAGSHREYNSYCVPTYMMNPREENIIYALASCDFNNAKDLNNAVRALGDTERYAALNVSALFKYGTLECRLLGTADYDATLNWLNILLSIKKAAMENSRSDLLSYASLPDLLTAVMPQAAELLVVNDVAKQHYADAKAAVLYGMEAPSSASTTSSTDGSVYGFFNSFAVHTEEYAPVNAASDQEPVPTIDRPVITRANVTPEQTRDVLMQTVFDDSAWATNAVMGSDQPDWEGISLLNSPYFSQQVECLSAAMELHGDPLTDYNATTSELFARFVAMTAWARIVFGESDNVAGYAMRLYNMLGRFAAVGLLTTSYPDSVNINR